jgi:hypothetical protein
MKLKNFNNFQKVYEAFESKASKLSGEVTLYRLTSHPVVDLSDPGEFYVSSLADVDPNLLEDKQGELFLITVKTNSDNIDLDESEKECAKHDVDSIVSVKNSEKCEVVKVEPYKG